MNELKLCKDCAHFRKQDRWCEFTYNDPVMALVASMDCEKARSREWACGAQARFFQAKDPPTSTQESPSCPNCYMHKCENERLWNIIGDLERALSATQKENQRQNENPGAKE